MITDGGTYVSSPSTDPGYPSPWESYNDAAHTVQDDLFTAGENTVYMFGSGFKTSTAYHIGYYDGDDFIVQSEAQTSTSGGDLSGEYYFPSDPTVTAGTWHAVAYEDAVAPPPSTYIASDADSAVEDNFEVTTAAIPEFPTVFTAIGVAGLCFGIYWWMRKKYQRQVVMA